MAMDCAATTMLAAFQEDEMGGTDGAERDAVPDRVRPGLGHNGTDGTRIVLTAACLPPAAAGLSVNEPRTCLASELSCRVRVCERELQQVQGQGHFPFSLVRS
jgi:hypothetical protein